MANKMEHTSVDPEMRNQPISYIWMKVIFFSALHVMAIQGILLLPRANLYTILFALILYQLGTLGITAGCHRLWAHKCYKARWPLRLFLVICNTISFEDSVIGWSLDHRVHHKWTETNADPYNIKRGFFFSHVGWLVAERHPENVEKSKQVDMSDLYADPLLRFQDKYYFHIMPIVSFLLPTLIPWYYWGESVRNAWYICGPLRYVLQVNAIWLVNSAAHMWGNKPYDKSMWAVEHKIVSFFAGGEGWHNYHHSFPWDYRASEFGRYAFNTTALFLDVCAKLGLAYDLRTAGPEIVKARAQRAGDGTHPKYGSGDDPVKMEVNN